MSIFLFFFVLIETDEKVFLLSLRGSEGAVQSQH